jgi:anti-anti-sigma factor
MAAIQAQVWKGSNFTIEQVTVTVPHTAVFRFSGPFTARDMFHSLTPAEMRNLLQPVGSDAHTVQVLDLTAVPYMDSAGLGMIASHHVRCQKQGIKLVLTGVNPKVLQLLQLTNLHTLIPIAPTAEEAAGS